MLRLVQIARLHPQLQQHAAPNRFGIDWRNEGGSHHVFSFPGVEEDVCVPAHRPIKPVYVRNFVALVDKAKALQ